MESDGDVIMAKTAGFCLGVKMAIDRALELAQDRKTNIYTLGPLIHNKSVIAMLEEKGIHAVDKISGLRGKKGVVLMRAHGIAPELEAELRGTGLEVVDATCPLVKRVHKTIKKHSDKGSATVIVGDDGHAEVIGLKGYANGDTYVVSGPQEAAKLPYLETVNVVAQTTQEVAVFRKTLDVIKKNAGKVVMSDTICEPTKDRQKETVEMAKSLDTMIVVGGKHSANTTRLANICSELGANTVHIENEDELPVDLIVRAGKVGVTAGASTPDWMTQRVLKRARTLRNPAGASLLEKAWKLLVDSCVFTAAAAVSLTYVCMELQGCRMDWRVLSLSGLFVFSLHLFNRSSEKGVGASESGKARLFREHKLALMAAALASGLSAMWIAGLLGGDVLAVVAACWLMGAAYPFRSFLGLKGFPDIPGSKDIVTALGWGVVCAHIPALVEHLVYSKANYLAITFAFLLVFVRSVTLGISAAHSDLIVGRESFYKALGEKRTRDTLFLMQAALTAILLMLLAMQWKVPLVLGLLAGNLGFIGVFAYYYPKRVPKGAWAESIVDGQFMVLALFAFASGLI